MSVLCFGEILWDCFPDQSRIGGAPYNVAAHVKKLGGDSYVISKLGDDDLGHAAMDKIKGHGVGTEFVQVSKDQPTGYVQVVLDERAIPTFTIIPDTAYDFIEADDETIEKIKAKNFDLFYFGTVAQKGEVSKAAVHKILDNVEFKEVFFDINIRKPFYSKELIAKSLPYATILKINEDECAMVGEMFFDTKEETAVIAKLFETYEKMHIILVTKGPNGATIYTRDTHYDQNYCISPAVDTVGSGDALSAGFITAYLRGDGVEKAGIVGNIMGDYVASQQGAIPEYDPEKLMAERLK